MVKEEEGMDYVIQSSQRHSATEGMSNGANVLGYIWGVYCRSFMIPGA